MSVLAEFFKGSDTQLGIFAPRDYLVALFPDFPTAQKAHRRLLDAAFPDDEVIAVPGEGLVDLLKEHSQHTGVATLVMQALSRMFETEEVYADHDFKLASSGAGFLAVHATDQPTKHRAWKAIEDIGPLVARHYSLLGVEHLTGET